MAEVPTRELLDPQVLGQLLNLPLLARGPMAGSVSGRHQSPHRGSSVEFAEYRKYVPGDDTRQLDWRVYARSDRFYMKEFEADTNLRCYLVLDCSGSMGFEAHHGSRFIYARRLLATLAYLVVHQGDAAGLYCAEAAAVRDIPPRRNAAHLSNIFNMLDKVQAAGETSLVSALHQLAEKISRRALVIIVSDLFTDPAALIRCFQHLRFRKHDLAVFHLLDPAEITFAFDRPTRFVDLEDESALLAEPGLMASTYRQALNRYLTEIRDGCRQHRADYHRVTIDQPLEKVLGQFLLARAGR